jgi:hypothetical protein
VSVRPAQDEYADVAVREYAVRAVELIQKQYTDSVLSVTVSDSLHVSERHFARWDWRDNCRWGLCGRRSRWGSRRGSRI